MEPAFLNGPLIKTTMLLKPASEFRTRYSYVSSVRNTFHGDVSHGSRVSGRTFPNHVLERAFHGACPGAAKDLGRRPWPAEAFGMTPNIKRQPSEEGMCVMYRRWWERIHKAAQTPHYKQAWKVLEKVSVQPILSTPIVLRLVQRRVIRSSGKLAQLPREERLLCFKFADSIGRFLRAPAAPFDVGRRRDVRRGKRDAHIATLLTKQLRNRVVRIVQEHHTWDQLRITSSLEQDPFFSVNCYHMNAMFALCRRFGKTTSACERWVGDFKYLWNERDGPCSTTLLHRLRARLGGLRGDGTDEALLQRIASYLMPTTYDKDTTFRNRHRNTKLHALSRWRQNRVAEDARQRPNSSPVNSSRPNSSLANSSRQTHPVRTHPVRSHPGKLILS